MQPRGPLEIRHLVAGRTQGTCTGQFNIHQSSKVRTIGHTRDRTWSPPPLGYDEDGEVRWDEKGASHIPLKLSEMCSVFPGWMQEQVRTTGAAWHHCSHTIPRNNQGSISGKRPLVSLSDCHKSTGESSATFFPAKRCVWVEWATSGWKRGGRARMCEYFSWATLEQADLRLI